MHNIQSIQVLPGSVNIKYACGVEHEQRVDDQDNELDGPFMRCGSDKCKVTTPELSGDTYFLLGMLRALIGNVASDEEMRNGIHFETRTMHGILRFSPDGFDDVD